jgi:hypothetical protein
MTVDTLRKRSEPMGRSDAKKVFRPMQYTL